MARGDDNHVPRGLLVIVTLLFLGPGGVFLAKGGLEIADRFAATEQQDATLTDVEVVETFTGRGRTQTLYRVSGERAGGTTFEIDDRNLFDLAEGRTPLPVRVDVSRLSGRVLTVRSDFGTVARVGGATGLPIALLGLGLGAALAVIPLLLPWKTRARKAAASEADPPPPDWAAVAIVLLLGLAIIGGTVLWDLSRAG